MKHASRREVISWMGAAGAFATGLFPSLVQANPSIDTMRVVVGFAPGGTADTVGRWLANALTGRHAESAMVENRSGAGGQIAIQAVKSMPNDGKSILVTPASMLVIYPYIYQKLAYDPMVDLTPLSMACRFDFGFAVGPLVPDSVTNIQEFLAWARDNPTKANFGSPASGSMPHFIGELLGKEGGVDLQHIPYRGSQPAIVDLIGGQVAAVSGPVGEFLQHLPDGKIRLLATSGAERSSFAPDIATFREQGLKDFTFNEWFGIFGPANLSPETTAALNTALRQALASREVREGLATMAMEVAPSSPGELRDRMRHDLERWRPIVAEIGFTAD